MSSAVAYLDSSAFVKLIGREPESQAFSAELRRWARLAASDLLAVEVMRAARRQARARDAVRTVTELLRGIALQPLSGSVMRRAAGLEPVMLRTLDALHLATALEFGAQLGAFFTYDRRLDAAARDAGLPVFAPGA